MLKVMSQDRRTVFNCERTNLIVERIKSMDSCKFYIFIVNKKFDNIRCLGGYSKEERAESVLTEMHKRWKETKATLKIPVDGEFRQYEANDYYEMPEE